MKKTIIYLLFLLALTLPAFADGELQICHESGYSIYAIIRNPADDVWNTAVTPAGWRTWNDANITDYDIALTDRNGDSYRGSFPTGITTAGTFSYNCYLLDGGSPAITDSLAGIGVIVWNGSAEISEANAALTAYGVPVDSNVQAYFAVAKAQRDVCDTAILATGGPGPWTTGGDGNAPTAEEIREEIDDSSTQLAAIRNDISDVNEKMTEDLNDLKTIRSVPGGN